MDDMHFIIKIQNNYNMSKVIAIKNHRLQEWLVDHRYNGLQYV